MANASLRAMRNSLRPSFIHFAFRLSSSSTSHSVSPHYPPPPPLCQRTASPSRQQHQVHNTERHPQRIQHASSTRLGSNGS
ncbi:hypothetical protein M407DRAFT_247247 [Tulasnella calospora MUT 4182]|uniref:Uncharacterized protein n=1 Tax=Tulasnella calospora MUT 4182 TaxID=1051891 RepID=A0A0C3K1V7_9AGAM|nr:hypothetical protein M407DRAFT_247247 [Tulasnella calospora MUT 4182]